MAKQFIFIPIGVRIINNELQSMMLANLDESKKVNGVYKGELDYFEYPVNRIIDLLKAGTIRVEGVTVANNKLVAANGAFTRYPDLNDSSSRPLVIISRVNVNGTKGFNIIMKTGKVYVCTEQDTIAAVHKYGIANGKLVRQGDTEVISSINGEYDSTDIGTQTVQRDTAVQSTQPVQETDGQADGSLQQPVQQRTIAEETWETKDMKDEYNLTPREKVTIALRQLKKANPFVWSVLTQLNQVWNFPPVKTMAVGIYTQDLYICEDFVHELGVPQVTFVLAHEAEHIIFGHTRINNRFRGMNPQRLNIAQDIFINTNLAQETGITKLDVDRLVDWNSEFIMNEQYGTPTVSMIKLNIPSDCCIDLNLDISKVTVEDIYAALEKQQQQQQQQQQQSGQSGQGQSSKQGGQEQSGQGQSNEQNQEQDSQEQSGGGQGDEQNQEQGEQNGGGESGNQNGEQSQSQGGEQSQGQNGEQSQGQNGEQSSDSQGQGEESYTYNGQQVQNSGDVYDDKERARKNGIDDVTAQQAAERKVQRVLQQAVTVMKQMGNGVGKRYADAIEKMKPAVNFVALLKGRLNKVNEQHTTWKRPGRRGEIMAGVDYPGRIKEASSIMNVLVGIDTSNSIDQDTINLALGAVYKLCKQVKAECEVCCWSTVVSMAGTMIKKPDDVNNAIKRMKGNGIISGGTDVKCLFGYAYDKQPSYEKVVRKEKPYVLVIITDGCFRADYNKYKGYGKDVIWLLDTERDYDDFKPLLGQKSLLDK